MNLGKEPTCFVRIVGRKGRSRELRAILSTGSYYCSVPMIDAYRIGYPDAIIYSNVTGQIEAERPEWAVTLSSLIQAPLVVLDEVSIGNAFRAENVEALAYHPPEEAEVEVVLGRSFLKNFKLTYDPEGSEFVLESGSQQSQDRSNSP
ncbi:MAG: hypothetical protein JRM80_05605 [Nitrososphaerota archaeon]|nr:hypothetical protein [Nitrososphaerota archaeon]